MPPHFLDLRFCYFVFIHYSMVLTPSSVAGIAVACNDQLFYDAFDVEYNEHACLKLYLL